MADWETIVPASQPSQGGWETIVPPKKTMAVEDAVPKEKEPMLSGTAAKVAGYLPGVGMLETAANMASGLIAKPVSDIAGLAATAKDLVTGSKSGDPAGFKAQVQNALTYEPRTDSAKLTAEYNPLALVGKGVHTLAQAQTSLVKGSDPGPLRETYGNITGAIGEEAANLAMMAGGVKGVGKANEVPVKQPQRPAPPPMEPTYKGVIAGAVEKAKANAKEQNLDWSKLPVKVRRAMVETAREAVEFKDLSPEGKATQERLAALPVPVKSVTKGQLERDPVQLRKEQQLAQTEQGEVIRDKHIGGNKELLDNLELLAAKPGARAKTAEQAGAKVDFALRGKEDASKANYKKQYKAAENSVEGRKPASIKPVVDFLNDDLTPGYHTTAETALVKMKAIKKDAQGNWMPARDLTLKELEKVRVVVGAERANGGAAAGAASKLVGKIDDVFKANEGEKYKAARKSFELHQEQFKDTGSVAKIVGDKTRVDRTTALENVYKKTVETGSIQDLRNVRDALLDMETKGTRKQGRKAWRELAGQTVKQIKQAATDNLATDETRDKNFSPSGMKSALDKIGDEKLDILLGPGVAKQLRDVLAGAIDIKTSPPKRIQGSDTVINTMTVANGILDKALHVAGKVPIAGPLTKGAVIVAKGLYDKGKQDQHIREAVGLTLKKAPTEARP